MKTFLSKIGQLSSVQHVLLLSHQGDMLFCIDHYRSPPVNLQTVTSWNNIINDFNKPVSLELLFSEGLYYLHATSVGYAIIGMTDDKYLTKIKNACLNVQQKLTQKGISKKVLLGMLAHAADYDKPFYMRALLPIADEEVAKSFIKIIQVNKQTSSKRGEGILLAACQALAHCSYVKATIPLKELLKEKQEGKLTLNDEIIQAIELAVRQLEMEEGVSTVDVLPDEPVKNEPEITKVQRKKAIQPTPPLHDFPEKEDIESLLAENKKNVALQEILSLIESAAQQNQFDKAEELRDWIMKIDPMALVETIRAADIIEENKKAQINDEFYNLWQGLTEILSPEEFIALYHSMKVQTFAKGESIAEQGMFHTYLFFINSGRVQLSTKSQQREIQLKILEQGALIGFSNFFQISVWTVSAKSLGAEIYSLSLKQLKILGDKFPGIESKLSDYCNRLESSTSLLQKMNRSRRQLERKIVSGRIAFSVLTKSGKKTNIGARGEMLDISLGGICFTVRSTQRTKALELFAQKISILIERSNLSRPIVRSGIILAVRDHDLIGNEYSMHIKFDTPLKKSELRQVVVVN